MEVTNWRLECHWWCAVSTATHIVTHTHIMPAIWICRHFFSVYHQSGVFMQRGEVRRGEVRRGEERRGEERRGEGRGGEGRGGKERRHKVHMYCAVHTS